MREWLYNLRTAKGLTMKELGEKLGISESYYFAIEKGERQKKMDIVLAAGLSAALDVPVADIILKDAAWRDSAQTMCV